MKTALVICGSWMAYLLGVSLLVIRARSRKKRTRLGADDFRQ